MLWDSIWSVVSFATWKDVAIVVPNHSVKVVMRMYSQLKTVTPAQSKGQYSAGSTSVGTETTASVRNVTYSAYPPSGFGDIQCHGSKFRQNPWPGEDGPKKGLTSGDAIDLFIITHLVQPALTCGAGT